MANGVVVVGSLSVDFVMRVPRRPEKGETISGFDFNIFVGGKGNNQALGAARAGAPTEMIGCVGNDEYGTRLQKTLEANKVSTEFLYRADHVGTGIANIYVDPEGDNSIVIVPQSNYSLTPEKIDAAKNLIAQASVLMLQLEIPIETVVHAAKLARSLGVKVLLNPAPAPPSGKLPAELLANTDLLIPNQTEAELLTGIKISDVNSATLAARKLRERGVKEVIITLGADGALAVDEHGTISHIASFSVNAIDTTAAGDAFCGALAAAIVRGESMTDAVRFGCAAGALATTKPGAEPSLPPLNEIENLLQSSLHPLQNS